MTQSRTPVASLLAIVLAAIVTAVATALTTEAATASGGAAPWIANLVWTVDSWTRSHLTILALVSAVPLLIYSAARIARLVRERRLPFTTEVLYSSDQVSDIGFTLLRWWTAATAVTAMCILWKSPVLSIAALVLIGTGAARAVRQIRRVAAVG